MNSVSPANDTTLTKNMTAILNQRFEPQAFSASLYLVVLTGLLVLFCNRRAFLQPPLTNRSPKHWKAHDWPIVGSALQFYSKRRDMLVQGNSVTSNGTFSFYVGKKQVVNLGGLDGRKTFYETKGLNLAEGFVELLAGMPSVSKLQDANWVRYFNKVLSALTSTKCLTKNLSILTTDARNFCAELAAAAPSDRTKVWRVTNTFESVYELVYKLTMRIVGATEVAEDRKLLRRTLRIFEQFEKNCSTARIIFPWLLTPAHLARLALGTMLYMDFSRLIKTRKKTGKRESDAVQYLLDQEGGVELIIRFEISALWAGLLNTGINASWLPIFLTQNTEWLAKVRAEVDDVVARHQTDPDQSAADVLDTLSLEVWETEFPMIDICLRETIRLVVPGAMFRKNTSGSDIPIGSSGEVIPNGAFASYLLDNMHMNSDFYPDPLKFNPGRYLDNSVEATKQPHVYLGWGSGRHPCIGMRFAKLEMALINAYFIGTFDFELSDKMGNSTTTPVPAVDRNAHTVRKSKEPIFLRYKPRKA